MRSDLNCIILKTNDSADSAKDRYVDFLKPHLDTVIHINPLKFEFVNIDSIRDILGPFFTRQVDEPPYKSLILTSRQTVECLEKALIGSNDDCPNREPKPLNESISDCRGKLIVYCVGEATMDRFARFVARFGDQIQDKLIVRTGQKHGIEDQPHKQNGEYLGRLIESDFRSIPVEQRGGSKFALYPCSSIRKGDVATILTDSGNHPTLKPFIGVPT